MEEHRERLAVLETKVAGIETRSERIEGKIDKLADKIDHNFVRYTEIKELEKDIDSRFDRLEKTVTDAVNDKTNERWVMRLLLAVSVIVNIVGVYNIFTS